ncbi:hypothetical protein A1D50_18010 [Salmonella enterica]|uniref:Lipoprotein n=2 Tax=Salmonella enterica TaxID=28901 RepID=A0A743S8M8_SALER|nr:hypothetical protein [Salmonella enterica]EBH8419292.1 hypothetical protein [Salmonella enterica subsp. enterica serovar Nijmegen]EBY1698293.1 hypothetical protein [Salmonella enterica subsp. enterica serovar Javiana]ECH8657374.1 hypothetical protein [Salmonella enterica subsp. enterica serovar Nagoya]EDT4118357.1 hypothetical protein [Salmonella enterica subsp. enterica serovar Uzaramo]EDT9361867.1 hypothetical protein [Salmonella enterica subsp. enterica serovar Miami]
MLRPTMNSYRLNFPLCLQRSVILFGIILISAGCNTQKSKGLVLPVDSTQFAQLACYYKDINSDGSIMELKLPDEYKEKTKIFNQQEIKVPVKGENFLSPYIGDGVRYYELGYFEYDGNTYKLIIYNKIGESDTLLLNVQINSYDAKGNLVDALLLSSFFAYEDIVRFSDFVIRQDYTISIDSYVIYRWYEDSKDGHLVTIKFKDQAPQIYIKEQYQMENGRFKLISTNEVSQGKKKKRALNIPCLRH